MKDAAHKSKFHNAAFKPLENGSHISLQYQLSLCCNYTPAKLGSSQFQGPSLAFPARSSLDYPSAFFLIVNGYHGTQWQEDLVQHLDGLHTGCLGFLGHILTL